MPSMRLAVAVALAVWAAGCTAQASDHVWSDSHTTVQNGHAVGTTGSSQKSYGCGSKATLQASATPDLGSIQFTLKAPSGATTSVTLNAGSREGKGTLSDDAGTWTLTAAWTDFSGSFTAHVTC
jgi:hypothetical protein